MKPEVDPEKAAIELEVLELEREGIYGKLKEDVSNAIPSLEDAQEAIATEKLYGDPNGIIKRWEAQKDRLEDLKDQLEDLDVEGAMGDRLDGGMPDDFDGSMGGLSGDVQEREWPHPWRLDPSGYPGSFSYLAVGLRTIRKPIVPVHFRRSYANGVVYAAARVYNTTRPDLWTADWRARLVKTELSMLANPLGSLPSECGESKSGSGLSQLSQVLEDPPSGMEVADMVSMLEEMFGFLSKH